MSWLYLFLSIIFETLGTTALKMTNGFTILIPSICTVIFYILCFYLFSQALKTIEVGVAYAIWGAFGMVLIATIGILFFNESVSFLKILSIFLIIAGTVGLRLAH